METTPVQGPSSLPAAATGPAAGALTQPASTPLPSLGRIVLYTDRRTLEAKTCPAIITEVLSAGPLASCHLTAFPPRQASYPVNAVRYVSLASAAEPCWHWPPRVGG